jgi:hypothetical protein
MAALLVKAGASLSVKALLDNLQITSEFESTMAKKWATPVGYISKHLSAADGYFGDLKFQTILNATAGSHAQPPKSISSAFNPHMSIFVNAQDK